MPDALYRAVRGRPCPRAIPSLGRWFAAAALAAMLAGPASSQTDTSPILIDRQGSFPVGGTVVGDPLVASQHCDHGSVEYQIPPNPRAVNLLMWHSASASAWQNRWDGGEGFQSIFVRRGFPVYLWDGPRVGRANWGCAETTYAPEPGRDQQNFAAWRLGVTYLEWFEGVQFPVDDPDAWIRATRARYQEFDTVANAQLESDAAAVLADQIGPTVALTNSAGGLRALLTALKSDNIKGIVAYENVGFVYPEGEGPDRAQGPFGPVQVPLEEFRKLTRIPLQMVWGDNLDKTNRYSDAVEQSKLFAELINKYGGNAEVLMLPEAGLVGNTHIPFADLNNVEVADLVSSFLEAHGLDAYAASAAQE